jgi:hypothetical protein
MRGANVAAAGFAVSDGAAADPGGLVHVAPGPDRFGRILLACVEPLDFTSRGMELASVALRAIRETFAATPGPAAEALATAFAAANAAVIQENRSLANGRWERRLCIGATGVAIGGRDIVVAQASPTQAILVQDRQVYAFPDVASWRGDYVPGGVPADSLPLGFAEDESPRLYHSEAAPGDLIALCATGVGRALGRDENAVVELYGGALLTDDLEGSVDRLERLLARHDVADGFAVVASVSRLPRRTRLGARTPRAHHADLAAVRPERATSASANETAPASHLAATVPAVADVRPAREPKLEGLRDWLIDLAELAPVTRRRPAAASETRQRALSAPGAMSVRRYREPSGMPAEWRAILPRGPGVHVPARLLAVSLVLFLALGGTGIAVGRQRDRETRVETSLVAADVALRSALENPGSAMSLVAEAEAAVTSAREAGASGAPIAQREHELAAVRDRVWRVQRLTDVVRVGALPAELGDGPVRMAISGPTLYVAAGNLFELDSEGGRLIGLLAEGDAVESGVAGDLRHVSVDGGKLVASDGAATYTRDQQGRWQRQALAVANVGGLRSDAPLLTWGDASYGLSWDGDIVRFENAANESFSDIWAAAVDNPDLEIARDIAIDGRIHVLLQDGRLVTFSRGALMGTMSPFVVPALDGSSFLAQAPFANAFYIVDPIGQVGPTTGRIVRVDATGEARQFLAPLAAPGDPAGAAVASSLTGVQDLAIDELTGTIYWIANNEIWQAHLPPA